MSPLLQLHYAHCQWRAIGTFAGPPEMTIQARNLATCFAQIGADHSGQQASKRARCKFNSFFHSGDDEGKAVAVLTGTGKNGLVALLHLHICQIDRVPLLTHEYDGAPHLASPV